MIGASALANAILGRLSYDSPLVLSELSVLFGPDEGARHTYIEKTRARTMAAAAESLVLVEGAERHAYGPKSYYYCKENNIPYADVPDDDTPPDYDDAHDQGDSGMDNETGDMLDRNPRDSNTGDEISSQDFDEADEDMDKEMDNDIGGGTSGVPSISKHSLTFEVTIEWYPVNTPRAPGQEHVASAPVP